MNMTSIFQEGVGEHDIDALLLGMASQACEREDMTITPDLKGTMMSFLISHHNIIVMKKYSLTNAMHMTVDLKICIY